MNSAQQNAEKKPTLHLLELAIRYFKKEGYRVERENTTIEGFSGIPRRFDLIVQKGRLTQVVWIKDWNRTIGINMVITLDKASEDVAFSNPILIGEKFSDHAKAYANRRKIILLTKRQILQSLR
ncbi:MAG: restriction endonuclease [Candidatus Jordarchaeaceae archaeon]